MTLNSQFTQEQQELVDLIRNELAGLIDTCPQPDEPDSTDQFINEALLKEHRAHSENIGNAANLVGLVGLADCCHQLVLNFDLLLEHPENWTIDQGFLVQSWGIYVLGYLQYLHDSENVISAIQELIEFLQENSWPSPLSDEQTDALVERFSRSSVFLDDKVLEELPDKIDEEMASLSIGDDVRPELLEGLLLELPAQVYEFSTSVSAYISSRNAAQLDAAQRVAHTIKGAANIVNVRGIANLMHYTEELLLFIGKDEFDYSPVLAAFIQDISDCLEGMSEYLLGLGDYPDNAIAVLEKLLAFNRAILLDDIQVLLEPLDGTSLEDSTDLDESHASRVTFSEHESVGQQVSGYQDFSRPDETDSYDNELPFQPDNAAADEVDNFTTGLTAPTVEDAQLNQEKLQEKAASFLRVPDDLVKELLRLTGENIISNNRIFSQIESLRSGMGLLLNHHSQLRKLVEDFEHLVEIKGAFSQKNQLNVQYNSGMDPLEMEQYNELHSFSHQLQEMTTDSQELITQLQAQLDTLKTVTIEQSKINRDNQDIVLRTRMVAVETQSSRFQRCVRQANRLTGKNARLTILGDDILIDSRILNELIDPVMHLLRNAVDHGIEFSDQRVEAGKPETGNITLAFNRQGESIVVYCSDDGPGLSYERIEQRARERGLLSSSNKSPSESELKRLIMETGFSTREEVSQTSGRGIGLDVVKTKVQALNGQLLVDSVSGQGTQFTLTLPVTLLSTQALIVDTQNTKMAIISRGIEQIIYLNENDLSLVGDQWSYKSADRIIPVYPLSRFSGDQRLVDSNDDENLYTGQAMLLTVGPNGQHCGVLIEEILASQDVVVKPLNRFVYKSKGVIGATVAGDGSVYPVLDMNDLLEVLIPGEIQLSAARQGLSVNNDSLPMIIPEKPLALVVDDSLSARRSLAQFVSDIGLDVKTAKDGFEAISLINEQVPALMLVDFEMPRMNGLELTEHVRAREATKNVPVIMITSRTTEKHRTMAAAAGVNNYLNKPYSDDELLGLIQEQIV